MDKNISIVIPVHKYGEMEKSCLKEAIESFDTNLLNCVIVCPTGIHDQISSDYENLTVLENTGNTDFCSQVNLAASMVKTKYFSILELDDKYSKTWFKNVVEHIETEEEVVSLYLPLVELLDFNDKSCQRLGFVNEAFLAISFTEKLGFIDSECLADYSSFNITGGVFRTEDFLESGGLKPSIKLSFWYEFLLRFVNQGKKVYVIPKIGYSHRIEREDSLSLSYRNEMLAEEANWWLDLAKKEMFFKQDRNKTYEE